MYGILLCYPLVYSFSKIPVLSFFCVCQLPYHNFQLCSGFLSDEENDNEPIPFFLLPDDSQKIKKSPLMNRSSTPPQIQLVSLKNFSGLENVRAGQLPGQDSLDSGGSHKAAVAAAAARQQLPPAAERQPSVVVAATAEPAATSMADKTARGGGVGSTISNLEENKVKIQVPGLPAARSKTDE